MINFSFFVLQRFYRIQILFYEIFKSLYFLVTVLLDVTKKPIIYITFTKLIHKIKFQRSWIIYNDFYWIKLETHPVAGLINNHISLKNKLLSVKEINLHYYL